ncbi:Alpha/Beta hydrolase protein [Daldinia caldariorum]|uniref:Alpha/Beta hydrolase protein n=1 Tax=Daldinia caldariorum TaxID=326644 RepID=UPI0020072622|nr:Alpha/Beta hydrolase protein [Daldinia caldariorum]KAI1465338.1 Alpha/Beta hydrolase protein [Daldinia caldariorum]
MPPQPSLSFTLPSIHDNTKLDCRIYQPYHSNPSNPSIPPYSSSSDPSWPRHAAVVAHPYAPLGGSYDDPVVHLVASTLLDLGFVVATFNFRGASSSSGRTSWTSKPERADYMSVTGFLVYYMHYLTAPQNHARSIEEDNNSPPILLFAGYSYGAMVTLQLPPIDSFLSHFASPATHTAFADIRLRAQHLAEEQSTMSADPASPRKSLGMRFGGDEDLSPRSRGKHRAHSPDPEEKIRRGVKDILSRSKFIHRRHHSPSADRGTERNIEVPCLENVDNLIRFRPAYLLVSPPLGFVTNLATMSFSNLWPKKRKDGRTKNLEDYTKREESEVETEAKLTANPTLVIYGDHDSFLSIRKMRDWATKLSNVEGSRFRYVEVLTAGHFWIEHGVSQELREAVYSFSAGLVKS